MKRLVVIATVFAVLAGASAASANGSDYRRCIRHGIHHLDMTRREAQDYCRGVRV